MGFPCFNAMRAVVGSDLSSTERFVFWALCIHASADARAWPGVEGLAKLTGLTERAVRNTIRKLEERKLIVHIEGADTKARMYELFPQLLPGWKQVPVGGNVVPGERRSGEPGSGDPERRSADPERGAPDRTTDRTTERSTEKKEPEPEAPKGKPQLRLVAPEPDQVPGFEEVAAYIGRVFNLNMGRSSSQGPERGSKRGQLLADAMRKEGAANVLKAFKYVAECQTKDSTAVYLRTKWVDDKGRSRCQLENVLRHVPAYAEAWDQEQMEGDGPHKPYVRGYHPGTPEPTEQELEDAYAWARARGIDVGEG